MSMKRKKAGLVISWQKSFSILAPWRKGKGGRDAVLDSDVVLTKMKLFSNFHEKLLMADDCASTTSTASVAEQDISDPTKAPEVNAHPEDKPRMESGSDYLSAMFSDSQLPRLYKFESEDSGVELPSGANSPSTPTGSEQSFMVHSRESSCNLNSEGNALPDDLVLYAKNSDSQQAEDSEHYSPSAAVDNVSVHSEGHGSDDREEVHSGADIYRCRASGLGPEGDQDHTVTESSSLEGACEDLDPEPVRRSTTSGSLEEYMDQCCRLSEAQQASSSPLGSGLGYLEHICQLIEKIGQLQETNLQLQRKICTLTKDSRMAKTKEDFLQQQCSCGAASLTYQEAQKTQSRSEFLSPSGTVSDLSTIHEAAWHPLISTSTDVSGEGLTPVPLWRRGLDRRSYTEGDVRFLGDSTERLSSPQRRLSENYTWGRVKDLVRKTKMRNHSRLGLTSSSLKMSCPQLYMPDFEPLEPAGRNRNSMIALGHQSKLDFPWLQ